MTMKYKLIVSKQRYKDKPNATESKFQRWIPSELDAKEMFDKSMQGYTLCGDFGFETEFLKGRTKYNWKSSPFIYVDLDNCQISFDELYNGLINRKADYLKPTYIYTTFSHQKPGKGNRFRVVYVFDKPITNSNLFQSISRFYNEEISKLFNIEPDTCNDKVNQCCYGTNKDAQKEYVGNQPQIGDLIKLVADSVITENTESHNAPKYDNKIEFFSRDEIIFYSNISYTDYLNKYNTQYITYTDNWFKLGNEAKRKDVVELLPKMWWNKELQCNVTYKLNNGQGRKRKLKTIARKIRYINKDISKDELLFNVVNWMYNYTIQGDELITWRQIIEIVNDTLNEDADDYMVERLKYLTDPDKIIKSPYLKKEKKLTLEEQDIEFRKTPNASVEDIMENMKVSRRTAYRIKDRNSNNQQNKSKMKAQKYQRKKLSKEEQDAMFTQLTDKSAKSIMQAMGVSKMTAYRIINRNKATDKVQEPNVVAKIDNNSDIEKESNKVQSIEKEIIRDNNIIEMEKQDMEQYNELKDLILNLSKTVEELKQENETLKAQLKQTCTFIRHHCINPSSPKSIHIEENNETDNEIHAVEPLNKKGNATIPQEGEVQPQRQEMQENGISDDVDIINLSDDSKSKSENQVDSHIDKSINYIYYEDCDEDTIAQIISLEKGHLLRHKPDTEEVEGTEATVEAVEVAEEPKAKKNTLTPWEWVKPQEQVLPL